MYKWFDSLSKLFLEKWEPRLWGPCSTCLHEQTWVSTASLKTEQALPHLVQRWGQKEKTNPNSLKCDVGWQLPGYRFQEKASRPLGPQERGGEGEAALGQEAQQGWNVSAEGLCRSGFLAAATDSLCVCTSSTLDAVLSWSGWCVITPRSMSTWLLPSQSTSKSSPQTRHAGATVRPPVQVLPLPLPCWETSPVVTSALDPWREWRLGTVNIGTTTPRPGHRKVAAP
jgi:hypothetical protein